MVPLSFEILYINWVTKLLDYYYVNNRFRFTIRVVDKSQL